MKHYSEDDIRQAVNEVIAAGMEKFLYQEPISPRRARQSDKDEFNQVQTENGYEKRD